MIICNILIMGVYFSMKELKVNSTQDEKIITLKCSDVFSLQSGQMRSRRCPDTDA